MSLSNNPISNDHVNIFFIEHAKAELFAQSNERELEKVLVGDLDAPLNDKGFAQAEKVANQLVRLGLVFQRILSSDLSRAAQTAAPLEKLTNIKATQHPELRETNKGDLQGKTRSQYIQLQSYKEYKALEKEEKKQFFYPMGLNAESKADAAYKMIPLLNCIRSDASLKGKCVAIFTHGNPLKVAYTLSVNSGSMEDPNKLNETLTNFPKLDDPKPCEVILYQGNATEFNCLGELDLDAPMIQLKPYPRLKV